MNRVARLLACFSCACLVASCASTAPVRKLTKRAGDFIKSVREDSSDFYFTIHQYPRPFGITFFTTDSREAIEPSFRITHSEAIRIVRHLAEEGLLDRTSGLPAGRLNSGWWVHVYTKKVGAHWYLGRDQQAVPKRADILGVRSALSRKNRKAWDSFLARVKE